MDELTAAQTRAKTAFLVSSANPAGREWERHWEGLLRLEPEFFEASAALLDDHWRDSVLEPKVKELILFALAAQVTTLHRPAMRVHLANALRYGATPNDIVEVLELVCQQGMSSFGVGIPIVVEELRAAGPAIDDGPLDARRAEIKERFSAGGPRPRPWSPLFEGLLRLDPQFFETLTRFIDAPWREGGLEPKVKELITVAMDVACTHLYENGLRRHVRKAIAEGAGGRELVEVIEMAAGTALISIEIAIPALLDHLDDGAPTG